MRSYLLAIFALYCSLNFSASVAGSKILPEKFLGSWKVDHSDDSFDDYLEAKGYGWLMRKVVALASITKIFTHKGDGLYSCKIFTTKKNVEWDNWQMDKEFQNEYLDESQHKITFTYDPVRDVLIEKHIKIDTGEQDIYEYKIDSEGWLVMSMEHKGVRTNRYYKKTN